MLREVSHLRRIHLAFAGILIITLALWITAETPLWLDGSGTRRAGDAIMQGTGVLAIVLMALSLILAGRPRIVEPWLGGLDKMYRLHKWLGITNLIVAAIHWQAYGLVRGGEGEAATRIWDGLLPSLHGLAVSIGDQAWKLVLVLSILALVKRFPYRWFFKSHWLFVPTYLILVFHAAVLVDSRYWLTPLGPVLAIVVLAGAVAGIRRMLHSFSVVDNRAMGEVVGLTYHDAINSLLLEVQLDSRWKGHQAGQFAFLTVEPDREPHPFTITSAWTGDGRIAFLIKELGDYTSGLAARLKGGDAVKVEGPWGRFDFSGDAPRQIWVGGGVGVTPFIARMQHLGQNPDGRPVDFFLSVPTPYPVGDELLRRDAEAAGVNLHLHYSDSAGFLTAEHIRQAVPQLAEADIWFCGPAGLGTSLKEGLEKLGISTERFHQELFEMR